MSNTLQLLGCVAAIYVSFLSWSYLQEKLTSSNYASDLTQPPQFFHAPLVINIVQCIFCIIFGSIYLSLKTSKSKNLKFFPKLNKNIILTLFAISISQSISAPLSYLSLDHVDYVLYLLAKSCKLIPVMLVHYLAFGTIYQKYKYIVAIIITLGVTIFTIGGMKSNIKSPGEDGNILLGLSMLCGSLFLDGFMNSAQDIMFKKYGKFLTGAHLMTYLNFFTFINLLFYTLFFTSQFQNVFNFFKLNGYNALFDLIKFSLCGSLGQIFIFITLEKFSSVVLVTVTVTRKMLSMVSSVFLFGHVLSLNQWLGLLLVFIGVGLESFIKIFSKIIKVDKKGE
jgi:UDP-galactose transporter B1